jgi:hypothetical protein
MRYEKSTRQTINMCKEEVQERSDSPYTYVGRNGVEDGRQKRRLAVEAFEGARGDFKLRLVGSYVHLRWEIWRFVEAVTPSQPYLK